MSNPLNLDKLEQLMANAKGLPWSLEIEEYESENDETIAGTIAISEINRLIHDPEWADPHDFDLDMANGELIVEGLNAVPGLIAEVKRLREQLAAAKSEGAAEELERIGAIHATTPCQKAMQELLKIRASELRKAAR